MIVSEINTTAIASKKLSQIERQLFAEHMQHPSISLMNGNGGLLLFYYNLHTHFQDETYRNNAATVTDHLLDLVNEKITSSSYCDGLTGLACLFNYLSEKKFFSHSIDPFLVKCDEIIMQVFSRCLQQNNADYLHGALGMAVYFLARYRSGEITIAQMKQIGTAMISRLEDNINKGIPEDEFTSQPIDTEARYFNCGMAHGLVSAIMFLSKYYTTVDDSGNIYRVLRAAIFRLLQFKSTNPATLAFFPSIVTVKGDTVQSTYNIPLGWCYGDTTISIGLYHAGMALKDLDLLDEATRLALDSTRRTTKQTSLVHDACFCHGSSGVAHIYKKWYSYTRNPIFKNSYHLWIDKTIDLCSFEDGIGGYKKCTGDNWANTYGMLDGACGPALVLTDFLSNDDTDWDRFFLLS